MKVYSVARKAAARSLSTTASASNNHLPIQYGLAEWWAYCGKVKKSADVVPFNHAVGVEATDRSPTIDNDNAAGVIPCDDITDGIASGCTYRNNTQARFVENAANEPGWYQALNKWKMRQDLGGHCTKYGLLLDDFKNILIEDYAEMRDRQYDAQRQEYNYRLVIGDHYAMNKEILPYSQWSPVSADHHYLNPIGRQLEAELDEKEIVNVTIGQGGIDALPIISWRTWARNLMTFRECKNKIDDTVLRSQF